MSDSMPNDYFSFMSDNGKQPALKRNAVPGVTKPSAKSLKKSAMIQRVFTRWDGER